jgi:hypothetical protein
LILKAAHATHISKAAVHICGKLQFNRAEHGKREWDAQVGLPAARGKLPSRDRWISMALVNWMASNLLLPMEIIGGTTA